MLFHSFEFIFIFLPIAVVLYYLLGNYSTTFARAWLVLASLIFYAWWNPIYVLLLLFSLSINFTLGTWLSQNKQKSILILGIIFNLGLLAYFKYYNFFIESINYLLTVDFVTHHIILPLAISFFTFQQLTYLVDSYQNKVKETSFLNYSLFVTFFPQLIAGPIVHHKEILPQFQKKILCKIDNIIQGLTLFLLGLSKKVLLADSFAIYADTVFEAANKGIEISFFESWAGVLSFSLQIYFDFSGYSDMAIGLALLFAIQLPINFNSPYQAKNIINFWRCWHITLSRFLKEYVYIPLGGNRQGKMKQYRNIMLTMLLGGLWHGASWTFILWGGLHGIYLIINHIWQDFIKIKLYFLAWILTLFAVIWAWVLFRATDIETAMLIYQSMLGNHYIVLPNFLLDFIPILKNIFQGVEQLPYLANGSIMGIFELSIMLLLGGFICLFMPNLYQISLRIRLLLLLPTFILTIQKILFPSNISPFLYFQF